MTRHPFNWAIRRVGAVALVGAALGGLLSGWTMTTSGALPPGQSLPQAIFYGSFGAASILGFLGGMIIFPIAILRFFRDSPADPESHEPVQTRTPPPPRVHAGPAKMVGWFGAGFALLGSIVGAIQGMLPGAVASPPLMAFSLALVLGLCGLVPGGVWAFVERWVERRGQLTALSADAIAAEIAVVRRRVSSITLLATLGAGLAGFMLMSIAVLLFSNTMGGKSQSEYILASLWAGFLIGGLGGAIWGAPLGLLAGILDTAWRGRRPTAKGELSGSTKIAAIQLEEDAP